MKCRSRALSRATSGVTASLGAAAACGLRASNGGGHSLALDRIVLLYYYNNTVSKEPGGNCMRMRQARSRSTGN